MSFYLERFISSDYECMCFAAVKPRTVQAAPLCVNSEVRGIIRDLIAALHMSGAAGDKSQNPVL